MIKQIYLCCVSSLITISSLAQPNLKPGQTFRDCPECPEMVVIPAGNFTMGSPANEPGRYDPEGPQRNVSIRPFAAGKFDVTRAEWAAFVSATNRPTVQGCAWSGFKDKDRKDWESNPKASWRNLGFPQDDHHPVVCITWNDAQDYLRWLSKQTNASYRLLTESEWEYAARAGSTTPYPWGSTATHKYANYGADSGYSGLALGHDQWVYTSPVGAFPPNAFGLYDMQGNVLQYVEDCFSDTYLNLPVDGAAYKEVVALKMTGRFSFMNGTSSCSHRMVRGGDWGDPPRMIRSAFRNWAPGPGFTLQDYRSGGVGFRVAKALLKEETSQYPTPGKFHKMLARSNGVWIGTGTMQFSPDASPVNAGTSMLTNTMAMDGLYQISEIKGRPAPGMGTPWTGLRITGYDNERKVFTRAMIGDGSSAGGVAMEGPWDETTQSITMPFRKISPSTGKERNLKEVYIIIDEDTEVLEIYATDPKTGKEFKMLNIKWTRKK